ncbi:phosphate ABC transporter permease subunit PstC [Myxococcus xanthus]|uniref:Phosphate transport system permease protein n=2 Tax=Myxococcaceae TaxID=31 RepID=A0AAE6KTV2_MYXXA|nr:phosphate ABC transporter permease subunit PstC [Myxococcus xanthus]QDE77022.1 phosphate ABC transporter permease subunit PstC [Myxococcus xanthus]QDE84413.1 phosphate ABC transporter permease subunit PstC [Myxococcus xanthus]QDE98580.1 phosphate ABC transporter permease subunit PstC [Myxococcus xanthus]QDF06286.1 phosphate ABC transporter permease subunit PstC [Myxococcus xanthus]
MDRQATMEQGLTRVVAAPRLSAAARRRQLREKAVAGFITLMAFTGIAALILIIVFVAKEALTLFTDADARHEASFSKMFLPQEGRYPFRWQPVSDTPKVSMIPLFVGTLKITLVSMLVAVPMGVFSALFVAEFAPRRLRELLKPVIELLAGIPSVVLGFFALMVLSPMVKDLFHLDRPLNGTLAGLALALAIVPVIFTVSEDALTAVPRSYREASLALGATLWETAWKVVLPAAAPGILAACVLGFGRAIGETMIVLMASGNADIVSWNLGDSARSLSATIAAEMGEVVVGSPHYSLLFFIGVELFIFTFVLNMVASTWTKKVLQRLTGSAS